MQDAANHAITCTGGVIFGEHERNVMDYGMTAVFGNLFEGDYWGLLASKKFCEMRDKLKGGESICRHCANAHPI